MRIKTLINAQIIIVLLVASFACDKIKDTSKAFATRRRRYLIYQEGVNWVQMVVGIGFPVELRQESTTWGATVKSYYLLPTNSNDIINPSINIERKKRAISRWELYSAIRHFSDKLNLGNGKSCLLRAICEASLSPFDEKGGLLAEILHVLLTPSTTNEDAEHHTDLEYHAAEQLGKGNENCSRLFHECNFYFLEQLSQFL